MKSFLRGFNRFSPQPSPSSSFAGSKDINILDLCLVPGIAGNAEPFASNLCRLEDMTSTEYANICKNELREKPRTHRKQWEFAFIIYHLDRLGLLSLGKKGLGFGVGTEPLPAIFASKGCSILATDAPIEANDQSWTLTNQHSTSIQQLCRPEIVDNQILYNYCSHQSLDMNRHDLIPCGYDFHWSSCVIEHLGSIQKGLSFIVDSCKKLEPGGVAVHTIEFNLSSNTDTLDQEGVCLFRRCDIDVLAKTLLENGLCLSPVTWDPGVHPFNYVYDLPPYKAYDHLKLLIEKYVCTSLGLIIHKSPPLELG